MSEQRQLRRSQMVDDEIVSIATYIATHNKTAGLSFVDAVEQAFTRIQEHPEIAGLLDLDDSRMKDVRAWPIPGFENYVILYALRRQDIVVLHVTHGGRDLARLLRSGLR